MRWLRSPGGPAAPGKPKGPRGPVAPVGPVIPTLPGDPVAPRGPEKPWEPGGPVHPIGPCGPARPVKPINKWQTHSMTRLMPTVSVTDSFKITAIASCYCGMWIVTTCTVRGNIYVLLKEVWHNRPISLFTRTWRHVRVLGISNPSVVCRLSVSLSVTFMHPTQPVEIFRNVSTPFCILAIRWPSCKILRDRPRGTPLSGVKSKWGSQI